MRNFISCVVLLISVMSGISQSGGPGTWVDYLPYSSTKAVINTPEKVYAATPYALIEIDKDERSGTRLSKVNGLSGTNVTALAYSEETRLVIVGYRSGAIDIISGNTISTFNDIRRATQFPERAVRNIYISGTTAYLSTSFGIINYNLERREVNDTYMIGEGGASMQVNDITVLDDTIYAATQSGVYRANINDNLRIYTSWSKMDEAPSADSMISIVTSFNGELIINKPSSAYNKDSLSVRTASGWVTPEVFRRTNNFSLKPDGDVLMVARNGEIAFIDTEFNMVKNIYTYGTDAFPEPRDVVAGDNPEEYWIADNAIGVIRNERQWENDVFNLESPRSRSARRFDFGGKKCFVASGDVSIRQQPQFSREGIYILDNTTGKWTNIHYTNAPEIETFFDFVDIAADPRDPDRFYAASVSTGLAEFENGELKTAYNNTNSSLGGEEAPSDEVSVRIMSLAFDNEDVLWMSITANPDAIAARLPDGKFISYNFSGLIDFSDRVGDMIVTQNGTKWVLVQDKGILVFDDNGTPENFDDDRSRLLTPQEGNGNLPSSMVVSIAQDLSGRIWVGTDQGVAVFFSPGSVFQEGAGIDAQQVFVEVEGFTQYLLENEMVTAVAVDGADRKWFGTEGSGVFLMSADGTEQIFHFTEENSSLLSDVISSIGVNPHNGEVMIATEEGITAFRGTATAPDPFMEDVYAYPNPVYPHYTGNIAIRGLAQNARVKITDINGNLVYDTHAEGGQAIWNGNNLNGERVPTGVYLVFAADASGNEAVAAKIMFVN